ncbi:MAG: hypothetical protein A2096_06985 [Spirochaetes bacterium GWF1_41_5]|nr:MAG: hypothetical protein A2096_06985 [Spirochaetes bacterium GWF1_41_5]HBE03357.1 hypothetical protein [Spirochaetia bacterium]
MKTNSIASITANNLYAACFALPVCCLYDIPLFFFIRDNIKNKTRVLYRLLCKKARTVITVSENMTARINALPCPAGKIILLENGFEFSRMQKYKKPKKNVKFLKTGITAQLVPWKNHAFFLDVARKIINTGSNIKFYIIGGDYFHEHSLYKKKLQTEIKPYCNIIMTGFIGNIYPVINSLDIIILPSINEPFGRIIIEAMFFEKIIFAEKSCGASRVIRHNENGFLFSAAEGPDFVVKKILELSENRDLREKIGRQACASVINRFAIKNHLPELGKIYA